MNTHIQPTSTLVERSGVGTRFTILHINEKDSFVMVWFDGLDGLKDLRDQITEYLEAQPKETTP